MVASPCSSKWVGGGGQIRERRWGEIERNGRGNWQVDPPHPPRTPPTEIDPPSFKPNHTDKKEQEIFLIYREIQRDRVQSHIWLTTFHIWWKYLWISSYFRKPFLIYDFATAPLRISLYINKKFYFLFYKCVMPIYLIYAYIPYNILHTVKIAGNLVLSVA